VLGFGGDCGNPQCGQILQNARDGGGSAVAMNLHDRFADLADHHIFRSRRAPATVHEPPYRPFCRRGIRGCKRPLSRIKSTPDDTDHGDRPATGRRQAGGSGVHFAAAQNGDCGLCHAARTSPCMASDGTTGVVGNSGASQVAPPPVSTSHGGPLDSQACVNLATSVWDRTDLPPVDAAAERRFRVSTKRWGLLGTEVSQPEARQQRCVTM
jgi:hypothetical protein